VKYSHIRGYQNSLIIGVVMCGFRCPNCVTPVLIAWDPGTGVAEYYAREHIKRGTVMAEACDARAYFRSVLA
jgi:pyruvate-formate lyase-activating enzyme